MFNNQHFSAQYWRPQYFTASQSVSQQDGRAGYWRLFYTQLQEQADIEAKVSDETKDAKATEKIAPTHPPKKKKVAQRKYWEPLETPEISQVPFRRKWADITPAIVIPNHLVDAWNIASELKTMVAKYRQDVVQFEHRLDVSDEDDVEVLLLLA